MEAFSKNQCVFAHFQRALPGRRSRSAQPSRTGLDETSKVNEEATVRAQEQGLRGASKAQGWEGTYYC